MLINCAHDQQTTQPALSSAPSPQTAPAASNKVDFFDSEIFDLKLGTALLASYPSVDVKVIMPFNINQIPKRLDVWLSAVQKYGGSIETKPDPEFTEDRGFITEIIDLAIQVYNEVKEVVIYGSAANYNVTLFYKPKVAMVTKLVFTHK